MWLDPNADGCVYDTVDCYHTCEGCHWAYRHLGGVWEDPDADEDEDVLEEDL